MVSTISPAVKSELASDTCVSDVCVSDTWIKASWDEFIILTENPSLERANFYYDHSFMRIEMSPVGPTHAHENAIASKVINLFAVFYSLDHLESW